MTKYNYFVTFSDTNHISLCNWHPKEAHYEYLRAACVCMGL